jgi:hypothetical protein
MAMRDQTKPTEVEVGGRGGPFDNLPSINFELTLPHIKKSLTYLYL